MPGKIHPKAQSESKMTGNLSLFLEAFFACRSLKNIEDVFIQFKIETNLTLQSEFVESLCRGELVEQLRLHLENIGCTPQEKQLFFSNKLGKLRSGDKNLIALCLHLKNNELFQYLSKNFFFNPHDLGAVSENEPVNIVKWIIRLCVEAGKQGDTSYFNFLKDIGTRLLNFIKAYNQLQPVESLKLPDFFVASQSFSPLGYIFSLKGYVFALQLFDLDIDIDWIKELRYKSEQITCPLWIPYLTAYDGSLRLESLVVPKIQTDIQMDRLIEELIRSLLSKEDRSTFSSEGSYNTQIQKAHMVFENALDCSPIFEKMRPQSVALDQWAILNNLEKWSLISNTQKNIETWEEVLIKGNNLFPFLSIYAFVYHLKAQFQLAQNFIPNLDKKQLTKILEFFKPIIVNLMNREKNSFIKQILRDYGYYKLDLPIVTVNTAKKNMQDLLQELYKTQTETKEPPVLKKKGKKKRQVEIAVQSIEEQIQSKINQIEFSFENPAVINANELDEEMKVLSDELLAYKGAKEAEFKQSLNRLNQLKSKLVINPKKKKHRKKGKGEALERAASNSLQIEPTEEKREQLEPVSSSEAGAASTEESEEKTETSKPTESNKEPQEQTASPASETMSDSEAAFMESFHENTITFGNFDKIPTETQQGKDVIEDGATITNIESIQQISFGNFDQVAEKEGGSLTAIDANPRLLATTDKESRFNYTFNYKWGDSDSDDEDAGLTKVKPSIKPLSNPTIPETTEAVGFTNQPQTEIKTVSRGIKQLTRSKAHWAKTLPVSSVITERATENLSENKQISAAPSTDDFIVAHNASKSTLPLCTKELIKQIKSFFPKAAVYLYGCANVNIIKELPWYFILNLRVISEEVSPQQIQAFEAFLTEALFIRKHHRKGNRFSLVCNNKEWDSHFSIEFTSASLTKTNDELMTDFVLQRDFSHQCLFACISDETLDVFEIKGPENYVQALLKQQLLPVNVMLDFISLLNLIEFKMRFPLYELGDLSSLLTVDNLSSEFHLMLQNTDKSYELREALAAFFNYDKTTELLQNLNQYGVFKVMTGLDVKHIEATLDLLAPLLYTIDPYLPADYLCLFLITHICCEKQASINNAMDFENIPFIACIRKTHASETILMDRIDVIKNWALNHHVLSKAQSNDYIFTKMLTSIKKYHDEQSENQMQPATNPRIFKEFISLVSILKSKKPVAPYLDYLKKALQNKTLSPQKYVDLLISPNRAGYNFLHDAMDLGDLEDLKVYFEAVEEALANKYLSQQTYEGFMRQQNQTGFTPLHKAALSGSVEKLSFFLRTLKHTVSSEAFKLTLFSKTNKGYIPSCPHNEEHALEMNNLLTEARRSLDGLVEVKPHSARASERGWFAPGKTTIIVKPSNLQHRPPNFVM